MYLQLKHWECFFKKKVKKKKVPRTRKEKTENFAIFFLTNIISEYIQNTA